MLTGDEAIELARLMRERESLRSGAQIEPMGERVRQAQEALDAAFGPTKSVDLKRG